MALRALQGECDRRGQRLASGARCVLGGATQETPRSFLDRSLDKRSLRSAEMRSGTGAAPNARQSVHRLARVGFPTPTAGCGGRLP